MTTFYYPGYNMGTSAVEYLIDQLSFDTTGVDHYTVVLKSEHKFLVKAINHIGRPSTINIDQSSTNKEHFVPLQRKQDE
jgi:hypothetical protein